MYCFKSCLSFRPVQKSVAFLLLITSVIVFNSTATAQLIGYWKLDEGTGTTTVSEIDSPAADGSFYNNPAWSTDVPNVGDGSNYSLQLNGSSGVNTGMIGVAGAGARTIAAWIKVANGNYGGVIASWGDSWSTGHLGYRFTLKINNNSGVLRAEIGGGSATGTKIVTDGQWHHVVLSMSEGDSNIANVKFYIDGQPDPVSGYDDSNPINSEAAPVSLGYSKAAKDLNTAAWMELNGLLDEIRIYDHQLTAAEVQTLFAGSGDPYVYGPSPADGEQHVAADVTLSWSAGYTQNPSFDLNIGTTMACNEILSGVSTAAATAYSVPAGMLAMGNTYFWRVDVTDDGTEFTGPVWSFTVGTGSATDPVPADGANIVATSEYLDWTGDSLVSKYRVMFAPASEQLRFAGEYDSPPVGLAKVARAAGMDLLETGSYDWQVVTLDAQGNTLRAGPVWNFSIATDIWAFMLGDYTSADATVDDFFSYVSVADLLGTWSDGTSNASNSHAHIDAMQGAVTLTYDNTSAPWNSYISRHFASPQDWSADQLLSLTLLGKATNEAETLFVGLSDGTTDVNLAFVNKQLVCATTQLTLAVPLDKFTSAGIDLTNISELRIGTGTTSPGTAGTITIYDVMINPPGTDEVSPPAADLDRDFQVGLNDIAIFAADWAMTDYIVSAAAAEPGGLRASYAFEELGGYTVADSSGNALDVDIQGDLTGVWNIDGRTGGCIRLTESAALLLPQEVFADSQSCTLSFWLSQSADLNGRHQVLSTDSSSFSLTDSAFYDGSWNHVAITRDHSTAVTKIYLNGVLVARGPASDFVPVSTPTVVSLEADNAFANTVCKLDNLSVYSRALSHAEVVRLFGGADAQVLQPPNPASTVCDINADGQVDFSDYAEIVGATLFNFNL